MKPAELTQDEVIVLANPNCSDCGGSGCGIETVTCDCVFRRIFQACYNRYRAVNPYSSRVQRVSIHRSRPQEEYRADFVAVARRALNGRPVLLQTFNTLFAKDADAIECLMQLRIPQAVLFRRVANIKRIAGRAFRELQPYPLFPPAAYFVRTVQAVAPRPLTEPAKVYPPLFRFEVAA